MTGTRLGAGSGGSSGNGSNCAIQASKGISSASVEVKSIIAGNRSRRRSSIPAKRADCARDGAGKAGRGAPFIFAHSDALLVVVQRRQLASKFKLKRAITSTCDWLNPATRNKFKTATRTNMQVSGLWSDAQNENTGFRTRCALYKDAKIMIP
jgi:hypothetical protein